MKTEIFFLIFFKLKMKEKKNYTKIESFSELFSIPIPADLLNFLVS